MPKAPLAYSLYTGMMKRAAIGAAAGAVTGAFSGGETKRASAYGLYMGMTKGAARVDKYITQLAKNNDLAGLHRVAAKLVGTTKIPEESTKALRQMAWGTHTSDEFAHLLTAAHRDQLREAHGPASFQEIVSRPGGKQRYRAIAERERLIQARASATRRTWPDYLNAAEPGNVDPEKLVEVEHGGGMNFINDFLAGRSKGVSVRGRPDSGIWVHPDGRVGSELASRTQFYANQASYQHFDSPAMLRAKIPAKHLQAVRNGYEAFLPHTALEHLQSVQVSAFPGPRNQQMVGMLGPPLNENIPGLPEYIRKLRQAINNKYYPSRA